MVLQLSWFVRIIILVWLTIWQIMFLIHACILNGLIIVIRNDFNSFVPSMA
jgi:hypothetical protein